MVRCSRSCSSCGAGTSACFFDAPTRAMDAFIEVCAGLDVHEQNVNATVHRAACRMLFSARSFSRNGGRPSERRPVNASRRSWSIFEMTTPVAVAPAGRILPDTRRRDVGTRARDGRVDTESQLLRHRPGQHMGGRVRFCDARVPCFALFGTSGGLMQGEMPGDLSASLAGTTPVVDNAGRALGPWAID